MKLLHLRPLIVLAGIALLALAAVSFVKIDAWGATSPGTMVQLATSHVPTEEDAFYYQFVYPEKVRGEVARMTGGDPGPLRPWFWFI